MVAENLTKEALIDLYNEGYSDTHIGSLFGMTGEGVAYRRKKYGLSLSDKRDLLEEKIHDFRSQSYDILSFDYSNLSVEDFSEKYGLSKTVWKRLLKEKGVLLRVPHRVVNYSALTQEQRQVVLGGLLGDGSVSQGSFYYESHSNKQKLYLNKKHDILRPYSGKIYPVDNDTGLRFKTVQHMEFKEFFRQFYVEGSSAKQLPVKFLEENWHDSFLVYWYLDDGHFNDEYSELSIANKAPTGQLLEFRDFLENFYRWSFHISVGKSINRITFSKKFYGEFFKKVIGIATPDMYYKIPEALLTEAMVELIPEYSEIKPKFYRVASQTKKKDILGRFVEILFIDGFPEPTLTRKRKEYLKNITGVQAAFRLWESEHAEIYRDAKNLWGSREFLNSVAENVLSGYPLATGFFIRRVVRKLLNIACDLS